MTSIEDVPTDGTLTAADRPEPMYDEYTETDAYEAAGHHAEYGASQH